jgi:hypothetical protein
MHTFISEINSLRRREGRRGCVDGQHFIIYTQNQTLINTS